MEVEKRRNRYLNTYYTISHRTTIVRRDMLSSIACDVDALGRSNIIRIKFASASEAALVLGRIHFRCSEKPIHYGCIASVKKPKPEIKNADFTHFGCTYLMTALLRRNFTLIAQARNIDLEIDNVRRLVNENGDKMEKALTVVLAAVDAGKIVNFWHAIERQYHYYQSHEDEINYEHYVVPEKCRKIRRVTLTPTRHLLWAPEIMFGNRVLRNFDSEYALRVSFRDDNNSRLSFLAAYARENIFDLCIRHPMTQGIRIGGRLYEFLAWSNSQIRDHGIWMYARDAKGNSVREIRAWMGDFSQIHSVPKYMARMGQCFSQTEDAVKVPLDISHVKTEDDIEGGRDPYGKPYCFSDGVGKISTKLAKEVRTALGHDKLCSAFQIRYGGYKGMLVVDPTLKDTDIVFRKSMKKFDSPLHNTLEIAKTSSPIPLQLNRPFITILNDMGVRHRTFLRLQEEMLRTLTDVLFQEEKAACFLESKTPNQIFEYKNLSKSGIHLTTEPFFRSLLLALHRHHIEKIKSRANIAIDPSQGRNMLGVLDETGLLEYGQVFVQYSETVGYGETIKDTHIVQREVLVTKNPCLLPGDVRKFQAVDIPQLHHIVDCIVFPRNGARPHPNEMGGSDLDGDEYAVLWNDDLIFHRDNHAPGHFPSAAPLHTPIIRDSHMIDFLVEYIKNDQVGAIANAHIAHADHESIFSHRCTEIAAKFSYAVDYAKTGVKRDLVPEERPAHFPDFMEKNYKETYKSTKALGRMFRVAHDYECENKDASNDYADIQVDEDLRYPGWEKYKDNAIKSRNKYNTLLKTVLRNYGIQHEAEAFSGAFTNLHCRFHERKDRDEIEKVVVRSIKRLSKCLNEEFMEEFMSEGDVKEIDTPMLQKASAWYIVTYSDPNAKFLSFPWTVSTYLAHIKLRKLGNCRLFVSPIIAKMDDQIKDSLKKNLLPVLPASNVWQDYDYMCDRSTVNAALQVLILWAEGEGVIQKHGYHATGYLPSEQLIKLFAHVAELNNYIFRKGKEGIRRGRYSVAELCLEFFRFCLTLRFYNQHEVRDLLPFYLHKYNNFSKLSVYAYHRFALTGKFQPLYFEEEWVQEQSVVMKPIYRENRVFPRSPIPQEAITKAQNFLMNKTKAEEVTIREVLTTKKVLFSATGSEESIMLVKAILRKKQEVLKEFLSSGNLPEGY